MKFKICERISFFFLLFAFVNKYLEVDVINRQHFKCVVESESNEAGWLFSRKKNCFIRLVDTDQIHQVFPIGMECKRTSTEN